MRFGLTSRFDNIGFSNAFFFQRTCLSLLNGRFSETILTDNPDFVCMASAFGIPGETITRKEEVIPALQRLLASPTAYLLHVSIASEDNVWPLVPPGAANEQMLEANS